MPEEKKVELSPLDKFRDEKCAPIAQELLGQFATHLIPEDANVGTNPLTVTMLQTCLDNDLNIMTEVTYLPQLLLGALSGMNKVIQDCDIIKADDVRYRAIARKMLTILAESNIPMKVMTPDEIDTAFVSVKEKLNTLFKEENINQFEADYLRDMIFASFKGVEQFFSNIMEKHTETAMAKMFNIGDMTELTTKMVNDVLIK